ncbi:hypothetical protein LSTR_LSTR001696 [Laodelphax striatellus]|uniref:Uncharacterized protein n=1 Tax=Laodelphax striatellus TaxID=195883 RepID=A0A482XBU1_LAOST|nr:hypothetical protein LSTR_LSTR001696 [Laodelphax striatellus]
MSAAAGSKAITWQSPMLTTATRMVSLSMMGMAHCNCLLVRPKEPRQFSGDICQCLDFRLMKGRVPLFSFALLSAIAKNMSSTLSFIFDTVAGIILNKQLSKHNSPP